MVQIGRFSILHPTFLVYYGCFEQWKPRVAPAGDQGASACVAAGPSSKAPTEDEHLSEEHVSSHAVTPVDMQAAIV